ncbi:Uncharacterised protein [Eubacterium limosum]|uniref:Uncharacterized protein n=1 Tax=Eubacterium limosum TaxID=1736 RepID=A0A6N3HHK1_EUBLI
MIESHEPKNRDRYLKKLIGFRDTDPVKVITGIRRYCFIQLRNQRYRLWDSCKSEY